MCQHIFLPCTKNRRSDLQREGWYIVGPGGIYSTYRSGSKKQSESDSMMVIVQIAHLPSRGVFYLLQKARAVLGDINAKKASGPFCVPDL